MNTTTDNPPTTSDQATLCGSCHGLAVAESVTTTATLFNRWITDLARTERGRLRQDITACGASPHRWLRLMNEYERHHGPSTPRAMFEGLMGDDAVEWAEALTHACEHVLGEPR